MGFALLIGLAPFGVLSSSVLVPVLPRLAAASGDSARLQVAADVIGSLSCALAPLTGFVIVLSRPVVVTLLSGRAFQMAEVSAVAALLPMVVIGAAVGVVREVLVRIYYARSDARFPLLVSCAMLAANAMLDALSCACGWGAQGLVASTALANAASCWALWSGLLRCEHAPGITACLSCDVAVVVGLAIAASACAFAALTLLTWRFGDPTSRLAAAAACAACTAVGGTVYGALLLQTKSDGFQRQRAALSHLIRRGAH